MAQGSGSATVVGVLLCLLLLQPEEAQATGRVFTVGDGRGWTFNVTSWTKGKKFRVGDTLAFNYARGSHNVVALTNKVAYNWCMKTRGSKVYGTGKDRIKLTKPGSYYFICSFQGHCQAGMKIAIKAA